MRWWQQTLRQWGRAIQQLARPRISSLKGFGALFLVGVSLSVAIAACSGGNGNNSATQNPAASPVAANK
ncbi:MAG: sulfate ABC transporter substrate-binding protein, partial [Chroococcidiopsis sp.]